MIWRGNSLTARIFDTSGWYRSVDLGQRQDECEGGLCYIITQILDEQTSIELYNEINKAIFENSLCLASSGSEETQARLLGKLTRVVAGTAPALNAPLRKDEADYVSKFKSCFIARLPVKEPGASPIDPTGETDPLDQPTSPPTPTEIPWVPIAVGGGSLVLLALLS